MEVKSDTIGVVNAIAASMFTVSLLLWLVFPASGAMGVSIVVIALTIFLDYNFREHARYAVKGFAMGTIPVLLASVIAYIIFYIFVQIMFAILFGGTGPI